jgi:hypothetical protein
MSDPYGLDDLFASNDAQPSDPTHFPADERLEDCFLGSVMLTQSIEGVEWMKPSYFYFGRRGETWQRIKETFAAGLELDPVLISDRDPEIYSLLIDAIAEASKYFGARPQDYAKSVSNLAIKRLTLRLSGRSAEMSMNGVSAELILEYIEGEIAQLRGQIPTSRIFDRWSLQGLTATEAAALGKVERLYLVADIIREKSLTVVYGAPGEFKSALMMDMAICLANGSPWLCPLPVEGNTQHCFTVQQSRCLWLNYDQSHDDVIERLGALARAYGGGDHLTAISHSTPPAILQSDDQARALGAWCKANGYKVVFVDCLLDVKGKADLQEAGMGEVLGRWRLVCETGEVSVIIISHTTKATGDLYGSIFIKSRLDHLYHVSRPAGSDVAIIESGKQRSFGETGKLYARWTYQHFDGTRTLKTARFWGDSTDKPKPAHPNTTTQGELMKLLMASPGRGFSVATLTDLVNDQRSDDDQISAGAVRKAANRLVVNERNVGKSENDTGDVFYHFGELLDTL